MDCVWNVGGFSAWFCGISPPTEVVIGELAV